MKPSAPKPPLPGDAHGAARMQEMLRVNHAGEYGAQRIYAGQMAVLKQHPCYPELQHMAEQEQAHLEAFNQLLNERRVRPTALLPFWHVAGYALGAGTALLGPKAAMACTVAVESVISEHYGSQLQEISQEDEPELHQTIATFKAEEEAHHDTGIAYGAEDAPAYGMLSTVIRAGCRAAIKIAEKI
jgi:ubiquinone biosynthesis monooxygenase Coq7